MCLSLAQFERYTSCSSQRQAGTYLQVALQQVQHHAHLREHEHAVATRLQLREELVDQHELATRVHEVLQPFGVGLEALRLGRVHALDEVRVITNFAELQTRTVQF